VAIGIGISSWVWTSPLDDSSLELIHKAKQFGFDVFELALESPHQFDYAKAARVLKEAGMKAVVCGAWGPDRDLTNDDPALRQNSLDYARAALECCEAVGATVLPGPMYSGVGKRRYVAPEQRKREWELAVTGIRQMAKMAADHGVTLAVEPLNRFETDLVNTAAQGIQLCKDVGEQNVGLLLDTFHMNIEEKNTYAAIKAAGPLVKHVHACENDRGAPGSGLVHWAEVGKALKEIGYAGAAVIESFTPNMKTIAAAAAVWRPFAASQDDLARDGAKFLRGLLG